MFGIGAVLNNQRRRAIAEAERRAKNANNRLFLRQMRDTSNPFSVPEGDFIGRYRLSKDLAVALIAELRPFIRQTGSITAQIMFLCALHFYGHGSYQKSVASDCYLGLSQLSICHAIEKITAALNRRAVLAKWVVLPSAQERRANIEKNYEQFGLPGVYGYVDGFHIHIMAPPRPLRENNFVNRKSRHSINAQMTCNEDLLILNLNARFPGSCHDAHIWRNSAMRAEIQHIYQNEEQSWLLGDSGYPLECWLLTPVLGAARNSPECRYTDLHCRARNTVERCIGVLKARLRCLLGHRVLEYHPQKAARFANACAVLHNMCTKARLAQPDPIDDEEPIDDAVVPQVEELENYEAALLVRRRLIDQL